MTHYKWTVNLCFNDLHWFLVVVWIGDDNYSWCIRKPFKLEVNPL